MHIIRQFGLVALAALVASAMLATQASAQPDEVAAASYPASIVGVQQGQQTLTTNQGKVYCESTTAAELTEATPVLTADLTGTCSAFGSNHTIKMNGCKVEFNPEWEAYNIGPAGCGPIKLSLGYCQISIPAQNGLRATYESVMDGGIRKVLVTSVETHLRYTTGAYFCGGGGTHNDGQLSAAWLLEASGENEVYVAPHFEESLFASERYPASLAAEQEEAAPHSIGFDAGAVECDEVSLTGSLESATEAMMLTPVFGDCFGLEFASATIAMNGCSFVYWVGEGEDYPQDVSCPAGKAITVQIATCGVSIPAQTGVEAINYSLGESSSTGRSTISVDLNVSGLSYTVTQDGFLCPFKGTGARADGTYVGGSLVEGTDSEGNAVNIKIGI